MAKAKVDLLVEVGKQTPLEPKIHDHTVYAEMNYWLLTELHDKGHLPENWRGQIAAKFPDIG